MKPIFIAYSGIILSGLLIYFYNLTKLKREKKSIGIVYGKWSLKFNLKNRMNWINWGVVILYITVGIYFIMSEPHMDNDFTLLVFFLVFLSFSPTWNITVGSKGIILGSKTIPNKSLVERKIVHEGNSRYLILKWKPDPLSPKIKTKKIPIPLKDFDIQDNL